MADPVVDGGVISIPEFVPEDEAPPAELTGARIIGIGTACQPE